MLEHPDAPKDEVADMILTLRNLANVRNPEKARLDRMSRVYWIIVGFLLFVAAGGGILLFYRVDPNHPLFAALGW